MKFRYTSRLVFAKFKARNSCQLTFLFADIGLSLTEFALSSSLDQLQQENTRTTYTNIITY